MGIYHHVEDLPSVPHDYECCVHHLATGNIKSESLGPGAICIDAVSAAAWAMQNWNAINADVVRLCEIAFTVKSNQSNSANGS